MTSVAAVNRAAEAVGRPLRSASQACVGWSRKAMKNAQAMGAKKGASTR
jgi:hypothetical protein